MNENINDKELWSIVPKKYRNALHRIMDEAQADWLTVYVSGSYLEGFANLTSDLDIFVVHKGQVDKVQNVLFTNSTGAVAQIELTNDSMIDVEHLSEDRLFQIINKIQSVDWTNDDGAFRTISDGELQFVHRLKIGYCVSGLETFAKYRGIVEQLPVCYIIASRKLLTWHEVYNDALGAIDSKQTGTALIQSREAVNCAVDALLACRGCTNNKAKWRYEKLKVWAPELLETVFNLDIDDSRDSAEILNRSKKRLRVSQQISLKAQDLLEDYRESVEIA